MKNFRLETLDVLAAHNKSPNDVVWVGTEEFEIPIDEFWELADFQHHSGPGVTDISPDLIVVGADWWLERREDDGFEFWEFVRKPDRPWRKERVSTLTPASAHMSLWRFKDCSLASAIIKEGGEDETAP